ncbi:MAG: SMC-Scp complex subunit ScpB [Fimbriimonas ginsengisoli]|uniref:SMC-Scp complex subunit ScpB n=1 Tax=Fimbriimonas ginsengisoli TaxID=1005039 RepID=A0A931PUS4_FIMGI|nr:SMC-Scp complex subunit ScpB [Fimbriimonas ginsengisoli]
MNVVDAVEALLFAADGPLGIEAMAQAIGLTEGQTAQALEVLEARLDERGGLRVIRLAGGYQLCTKPEHAEAIARLLAPRERRLSKSLLEVLAIVAYRQPVTTADVEAVRGVQSDYALRALADRKLVRETGRKHTPGRPMLYGTTEQFLHEFGMNALDDLPRLDSLSPLSFALGSAESA